MSGIINGRYVGSETEDITDSMFDLEQNLRGGTLTEDNRSVLRDFFRANAKVHSSIQRDMRDLLDSTRLRYAEGAALDRVTEQIGVTREPPKPAAGTQQFYVDSALSEDVPIPEGTVVRTSGNQPEDFATNEYAELLAGNTSVQVGVTAVDPGPNGNVGPDTITVFKTEPEHPDLKTTNPNGLTGGRPEESDEELRERAERGGNEYAQATAQGIVQALDRLDKSLSVHLLVNDTDTDNAYGNNIPAGHMEVIVDYDGPDQDVINTLGEYKAACDPMVSGVNGTSVAGDFILDNGQAFTYEYSRPSQVALYVDVTVTTESDYAGSEAVKEAMVHEIGGLLPDGSYYEDGLDMGEDVLVGNVEAKIRDVQGVYNVTDIAVGRTSPPGTTGTLVIDPSEVSFLDARDGSGYITITEN